MEYTHGFGMDEHKKVPGKYHLTRNGRQYSSPDKKTRYLSKEQAHATILRITKEIDDAERAKQNQSDLLS